MNDRLLLKFTPQIMRGAEALGIGEGSLKKLLGVTKQELDELSFGIEELSAKQGARLEKKTGRSIGELAVLGINDAAPLRQRAKHAELVRGTLEMLGSFRGKPSKPLSPSAPSAKRAHAQPRKR